MSIADLIKEHEIAQAEAEQASAARLNKASEQLKARLLREVEEKLPDLLAYMGRTLKIATSNGSADYIYGPVDVPNLAKFYIRGKFKRDPASCNPEEDPGMTVTLCNKNPAPSSFGCLHGVDIIMRDAVASFLYDRRQEQTEAAQKERELLVQWANIRLGQDHQAYAGGSIVTRAKTPDEAREAYELLQTIVPPGTDLDEWKTKTRNRYDAWLKRYGQAREQKRRQEEEQRRREEESRRVRRLYRTAYEAWLREFIPIARANLEALAALRAELVEPFEVASLERGIVAADEDGERWIDTDTVMVIPWTETGPIWERVFDDGQVRLLRHKRSRAEKWFVDRARVVGIGEAITVTPGPEWGQKILADWDYFSAYSLALIHNYDDRCLYFSPLRPVSEVECMIESRLNRPPAPPSDEDLIDYQAGQVRAEVEALVLPDFGLVPE